MHAAKRVCITGINGFTGRALAALLHGGGWDVVGIGFDRLDIESDHLESDLGETERLAGWLSQVRPSHLIHLAAQSHVVGDPSAFFRTNVLGTESLLDAIERADLSLARLILASSANVYGNATRLPIGEDAPLLPANHYALSKAAMELLAAGRERMPPLIVTRPFNYIGPGQSERFVVSKIVKAFRDRSPSIRLGNIDVIRDLSDTRTICEAYRRLLDIPDSESSTVVNLCSGHGTSIRAVFQTMVDITGHRPTIVVDQTLIRPNEVRELIGSPERVHRLVGQLPSFDLRETLMTIYDA